MVGNCPENSNKDIRIGNKILNNLNMVKLQAHTLTVRFFFLHQEINKTKPNTLNKGIGREDCAG